MSTLKQRLERKIEHNDLAYMLSKERLRRHEALLAALIECVDVFQDYCCPYCANSIGHTYPHCLGHKSCKALANLEKVIGGEGGVAR